LIKATIPDQLLVEWFTKSLLPPIAQDVAMGGVVTEEEAIACAWYMDLIYSQSGTLFQILLVHQLIHQNHPPPLIWMELSVPSKLSLVHSRPAQPIIQSLPQLSGRLHSHQNPPQLKYLKWMQSNLLLHNNQRGK
jgi:hypothetical protein